MRIMQPTSVLVTGGRDYYEFLRVKAELDWLKRQYGMVRIVTGCADGADRWARNWALRNESDAFVYAARWTAEGKKAGPRRNQRMIDAEHLDICLAFPGGRGTSDCVRRAIAAGIHVEEVR